jgi:phage shock protein E
MLRLFVKFITTGLFLIMANTTLAQDIWIDVRTADEFNAGHLEDAIHIPYEEIAARISEVTTDKDATIRLYCRSGNRSGIAQQTLQSIGFTKVTNEGGYEDLLRKQTRR